MHLKITIFIIIFQWVDAKNWGASRFIKSHISVCGTLIVWLIVEREGDKSRTFIKRQTNDTGLLVRQCNKCHLISSLESIYVSNLWNVIKGHCFPGEKLRSQKPLFMKLPANQPYVHNCLPAFSFFGGGRGYPCNLIVNQEPLNRHSSHSCSSYFPVLIINIFFSVHWDWNRIFRKLKIFSYFAKGLNECFYLHSVPKHVESVRMPWSTLLCKRLNPPFNLLF